MKIKINIISILFTSLLLSACGGGGGNNNSVTLADLVGVWDTSTNEDGGLIDESYTVINADGTGSEYDYLGDSFDNFANCYEKSDYSLENIGGGKFIISDAEESTEVSFSISGDEITVTNGSDSFTSTRSELVASDFQPLCSEI